VVSVNAGPVRTVDWDGRAVLTGIYKEPVEGRRRVSGVNLDGDDQADREVHGGPTKSLYAYAVEDYGWWTDDVGRPLGPGTFGDNLTVADLVLTDTEVGERWAVGGAVLRVTEPRIPCYKLGIRMADRRFPARFASAARPGAYLAIEQPGEVGAGDHITVVDRPGHGLTVGIVERAYHRDRTLASRLLDVGDLSADWRDWAARIVGARAHT